MPPTQDALDDSTFRKNARKLFMLNMWSMDTSMTPRRGAKEALKWGHRSLYIVQARIFSANDLAGFDVV